MKIINKALRAEFNGPGYCEHCKRRCRWRDCHHIFGRGAGQVDIRGNLIALGSAFDCGCHAAFHQGKITRAALLAIAARREKTTPEAIEEEVYLIRRTPKP